MWNCLNPPETSEKLVSEFSVMLLKKTFLLQMLCSIPILSCLLPPENILDNDFFFKCWILCLYSAIIPSIWYSSYCLGSIRVFLESTAYRWALTLSEALSLLQACGFVQVSGIIFSCPCCDLTLKMTSKMLRASNCSKGLKDKYNANRVYKITSL